MIHKVSTVNVLPRKNLWVQRQVLQELHAITSRQRASVRPVHYVSPHNRSYIGLEWYIDLC